MVYTQARVLSYLHIVLWYVPWIWPSIDSELNRLLDIDSSLLAREYR